MSEKAFSSVRELDEKTAVLLTGIYCQYGYLATCLLFVFRLTARHINVGDYFSGLVNVLLTFAFFSAMTGAYLSVHFQIFPLFSMPKLKSKLPTKLTALVSQYGGDIFSTDNSVLFCKACGKAVNHKKNPSSTSI